MSFDLLKLLSENSGIHWDSNSQSGSSLGSVKVHSFTLFYTLKKMKCDYRASFLAHTFTSLCIGHEPKARVPTPMAFLMLPTCNSWDLIIMGGLE
jgi:hypothetical protein